MALRPAKQSKAGLHVAPDWHEEVLLGSAAHMANNGDAPLHDGRTVTGHVLGCRVIVTTICMRWFTGRSLQIEARCSQPEYADIDCCAIRTWHASELGHNRRIMSSKGTSEYD